MKITGKSKSRYSIAFIFSIFLHVFSFIFFFESAEKQQLKEKKQFEKKMARASQTIKLDSVKFISKKQLEIIKENNKQIVANELTGKNEKPNDSRFAGEKDQTFDRQTMAAVNGAFKKAGLGSKDGASNVKPLPEAEKQTRPERKIVEALKPNKNLKSLSLSDLGTVSAPSLSDIEKIKAEELAELNHRLSQQIKQARTAQGLARGSRDETGFSRNNDFIEDIPLGDVTNLNTTEYKYYGFYHRIRQRLEQHWGSSIQSKAKYLYKSGRRIPASENLITAISVTLDHRGQILEIKIEGTSGVRELDQAAIESFNKAGPFPNPPKGLLVDGRAVIQWGFVVKS